MPHLPRQLQLATRRMSSAAEGESPSKRQRASALGNYGWGAGDAPVDRTRDSEQAHGGKAAEQPPRLDPTSPAVSAPEMDWAAPSPTVSSIAGEAAFADRCIFRWRWVRVFWQCPAIIGCSNTISGGCMGGAQSHVVATCRLLPCWKEGSGGLRRRPALATQPPPACCALRGSASGFGGSEACWEQRCLRLRTGFALLRLHQLLPGPHLPHLLLRRRQDISALSLCVA